MFDFLHDIKTGKKKSVTDPGCLSRIPDPDFYPPGSRIQKQQLKTLVKKNLCHTFFMSHKFHKMELFYF
jgi:hypothetical protein